jgi:integrase
VRERSNRRAWRARGGLLLLPFPSHDHSMTNWVSPHTGKPMATIDSYSTSKGQTVYRVRIRRQGKAQTRIFLTKKDATHWARQQEGLLLAGLVGIPQKKQSHTLGEAFERYQREILPRKRPGTSRSQRYLVPFILKTIGASTRLEDITPTQIRKLCDALKAKGNSPATIVRNLALLSHLFSVAIREWECVDSNPVRLVVRPREPRGRERYLSPEEIQRLLLACQQSRNEHLFGIALLAISLGARLGEVLNLRLCDVSVDKGFVEFRDTKNRDSRRIALPARALETVRMYVAQVRGLPTDLLFPSPTNPQKPINIRTAWEGALRKSGLKDVVFHTLRHTCGSHLAMSGASLLDIATILGHRSLDMVKRYSHLSHGHLTTVLEKMQEQISL